MSSNRIKPQIPLNYNGLTIIGEAAGETEIKEGRPFCGRSGKLLDTILENVGIDRNSCHITNVFLEQPPANKIDEFFRTVSVGEISDDIFYYKNNKIVKDENKFDLHRLDEELEIQNPKLILLLGATALWRILKRDGITMARGKWNTISLNSHFVGIMPTWHPSAVLRDRNKKLPEFIQDIYSIKCVLDELENK